MASEIPTTDTGGQAKILISTLQTDVDRWNGKVDFWNSAIVGAMVFAALAAAILVTFQSLAFRRAKQLATAQEILAKAKEAAKEIEIATLNNNTAGLHKENLVLETKLITLQRESEPRRLNGEQKVALAKVLRGAPGENGVAVVSPVADGEAADFADDLEGAAKAGGWETVRIRNLITQRFGVAIITAMGTPSLPGLKTLSSALDAAGIKHDTFQVPNGQASISPNFQAGYIYLVVEHKPLPAKADTP